MNVRNREMTGVSDYVCTSTFCVRRSNSERDWTLLRRSIHASFRVCSCVYVNFSFMKRQQKLSLFFMPKRVATESQDQGELEETNDEGGEISTTASQPAEVAELPVEPTASTSTTVRKFRPAWKNSYPWLQYDEDKGMLCSICVKHKKTMYSPKERITFDLLHFNDTCLTTIMLTP